MSFRLNSSGQLLVNNSGQPIDCSTCPCSVACTSGTCDDTLCCRANPASVLLTVPTGTFAGGPFPCSSGDCSGLEGEFVLTNTAGCVYISTGSGICNIVADPSTFTCKNLFGSAMEFQYRFTLTAIGAQVRLTEFENITTSACTQAAFIDFTVNTFGSTLAGSSARVDCSLTTAITLTFSTQTFAGSNECHSTGGKTISVIAI